MTRWIVTLLLFTTLIYSLPLQALNSSNSLTAYRAKFLQARTALQKGDNKKFTLLLSQLKNYPLYSYLVADDLEKRFNTVSKKEMYDFLNHNANTVIGSRLQTKWLSFLAAQNRWQDYLEFYQPSANNGLKCLEIKAKSQLGLEPLSFQAISHLWMQGEKGAYSCEKLFTTALQDNLIPEENLWEREQLAINNHNISLAAELRPFLSPDKQAWVNQWLTLMANPLWISTLPSSLEDTEPERTLIIDGLERYAIHNPEATLQAWEQLQNHFHFSHAERQRASHVIGMALAVSGHPAAGKWLAGIEDDWTNPLMREWRIRTALSEQDWKAVHYWINRLPSSEKNMAIWRYWNARALEQLGNKNDAFKIYQSLSNEYNYYSVLARTHLHISHPLALSPHPASYEVSAQIAKLPGVERARELYYLHLLVDARREWQFLLEKLTSSQLIEVAKLATQWGWYDQAIAATKKIMHNPAALPWRYPLAYQQNVKTISKQLGLNPAWVYAVMHQESNFISDAKSSAGALGLMQLLPRTAYTIASRLNLHFKYSDPYPLFNVNTNILCGANYLDELVKRYYGNIILATTAYNAGPGQVQKWISYNNQSMSDADIWVETIPWYETRNYLKNIIFAMAVYEQLLKQPSIFSQLLQPINFLQQTNKFYGMSALPPSLAEGQPAEKNGEKEAATAHEEATISINDDFELYNA